MINVHLVLGSTRHDSRVLKETASLGLAGFFDRTLVLGLTNEAGTVVREEGLRITKELALRTRRLPRNLLFQSIKFAEWRSKLLRECRGLPIGVVHCHDLAPLPVAVTLKRVTGAKLVYDAHELESERASLNKARRRLAARTERSLLREVDALVTVSPSIAEWYQERNPGLEVVLVRNIPDFSIAPSPDPTLRRSLDVPDDALLFIAIGGFLPGRGIGAIIEAFSCDESPHHVAFMGYGPLKDSIERATKRCCRVHLLPAVAPAEVMKVAAGADVGLSMIEDVCLSYRYCLPNKLFESLGAGIPVLASDLPDQAALIKEYGGGWVVRPEVAAIRQFLQTIDAEQVQRVRSGLVDRTQDLRWNREARRLVELYRRLVS